MVFKKGKCSGINNSFYGKCHTEEAKKRISKTSKEKYKLGKRKKGMLGRKHTKETIEKIKKNHRNHQTIKTREKISKSRKGIKFSEEHKNKIRLFHTGRKLSEKTRLKMSKSHWQGGKSFEPYDKKFNNIFKRRIRKRDNQICMLCEIHKEKLSYPLCIHHINYDKLLSIPQNCISLCNVCHGKTNFNRKHWIKFFQGILAEKYSYQYENQQIKIDLDQ